MISTWDGLIVRTVSILACVGHRKETGGSVAELARGGLTTQWGYRPQDVQVLVCEPVTIDRLPYSYQQNDTI